MVKNSYERQNNSNFIFYNLFCTKQQKAVLSFITESSRKWKQIIQIFLSNIFSFLTTLKVDLQVSPILH